MTWRMLGTVVVWLWMRDRPRSLRLATALCLWSPPIGVLTVGATTLVTRFRRLRSVRNDASAAQREVVVLGELVALSLSAGAGFVAALDVASRELVTSLRHEVTGVVRAVRRSGAEHALVSATGHATDLYALAGRAMVTGAPLLDVVERFLADARSAERERAMAAARRLPVAMMFPLSLLILPGFVLLTIAPGLVAAVDRFAS